MNPIPIYDASAAVACTIDANEIPERIERIEWMRANLRAASSARPTECCCTSLARRPGGSRPAARRREACCQFRGFAVDVDDRELTLRWDGPPATRDVLDRLHAYFIGTEPMTISGLL